MGVQNRDSFQIPYNKTHLLIPSGVNLIGISPSRCAMYSSLRTLEFSWYSTRSMAKVGTSAIMIRRIVLAMLVSVSDSTKDMKWGAMESTSTLGKRCWGILKYSIDFFLWKNMLW